MQLAEKYEFTREQIASITDPETVFGTTRLLAPEDAVPVDFARGNLYTAVAQAIFNGDPLPDRTGLSAWLRR